MCELDAVKGVDIGNTYRNDKAAQTFTFYIVEVLRQRMEATFNAVHYLAVMMDGSTDKAIIEQEIVYARYATKGVVKEQFVSLQHVEKADAPGLVQAVDRAMVSCAGQREWRQKVVAIGTDGASVNMGKNNGVIQRLRNDIPHLVGIHCMAHRLELSLNDAAKAVTMQRTTNQTLLSLYLFYHNSSLNRSNLKASYDSLDLKFLVPPRVGGTRWAAHTLRAITNLIRGYPALVQHLQQVVIFNNNYSGNIHRLLPRFIKIKFTCENCERNNKIIMRKQLLFDNILLCFQISSSDLTGASSDSRNKAVSYLRILQSKNHLLYLHFLDDVLTSVSKFSLLLQKREINLSQASGCLQATQDVLIRYKTRYIYTVNYNLR